MKKHSDGSSIYKGVCMDNAKHKWKASIRINARLKHLGYFANERNAGEAYNAAALEHFKEYAKLNELD